MKRILSLVLVLFMPVLRSGADLTATVTPGYVFGPNERPTTSTLNQLGQPSIQVAGTITGTAGLAAGTVTGNLLADSVPDGTTLDFNGASPRQLEIKTGGVGPNQINSSIAGTGLTGGSGSALSVTIGLQAADLVGQVVMYAANAAPTGWLECNGAAVPRNTYSNLFGVIGTTFGTGNGTTTFNLPQLQGNFVRGWANAESTNDTGRAFGSWQTDTNAPHTHFVANTDTRAADSDPAPTPTTTMTKFANGGVSDAYLLTGSGTAATIGLTSSSGNTESRPRNVALMYLIKW